MRSKSWSALTLLSAALFSYYFLLSVCLPHLSEGPIAALLLSVSFVGFAYASAVRFFAHEGLRGFVGIKKVIDRLGILALPSAQALSIAVIFYINSRMNEKILAGAAGGGALGAVVGIPESFLLALVIAMPFVLYGNFLATALESNVNQVGNILASEWLGTALGLTVAVFGLKLLGFEVALLGVSVMAVFACWMWFTGSEQRRLLKGKEMAAHFLFLALLIAILFANSGSYDSKEFVARQFASPAEIRVHEQRWSTHALLTRIEEIKGERSLDYILLGKGLGRAQVPRPEEVLQPAEPPPVPLHLALSVGEPATVSVLFAGAGVELFEAARLTAGRASIDGVELNEALVRMGRNVIGENWEGLLKKHKIQVLLEDARGYLERLEQPRDLILSSWIGSPSFFNQMISAHTAQFSFTREGLSSAVRALSANGGLFIVGGNKINLLISLRKICDELGLSSLRERLVILRAPGFRPGLSNQRWDQQMVYFKKNGWSDSDLARLREVGERFRYTLAIAPRQIDDTDFWAHADILDAVDLEQAIARVNSRTLLHFSDRTDLRPFAFNVLSPAQILTAMSGSGTISLLLLLLVLTVGLLVALLMISYRRMKSAVFSASARLIACGIAHMAMQLVFFHYAFLWFGLPPMVVVFGGALVAGLSGAASLVVNRSAKSQAVNALLTVFGIMAFLLAAKLFSQEMFRLGFATRVLCYVLLILPGAFFSGWVFSRLLVSLKEKRQSLLSWGLALDSAAAALMGLVSPVVIDTMGIDALALIAAGGYGLVAILALSGSRSFAFGSNGKICLD